MAQDPSPPPSTPFLYDQTLLTPSPPALFTNKIMISAIITLFCVIVFVVLLHLYVRWLWWRDPFLRAHGNLNRTIHRMSFPSAATEDMAVTGGGGLSKSEIDLLPVFTYQKESHTHDKAVPADLERQQQQQQPEELTECAVCLSEFGEGEALRMLPGCRHCFHTECIDMWFYSHSTCPLCRAKVMVVAEAAAGAGAVSASAAASPTSAVGRSRSNEEFEEGLPIGEQQLEVAGNYFAFWENSNSNSNIINPTAAHSAGELWMMSTYNSSSSSPFPPTPTPSSISRRQQRFMSMTGTRSLPHIRIDVVPLSPAGCGAGPGGSASNSSTSTLSPHPPPLEQGANYLRSPLRSPGLRVPLCSIRRIMLLRGGGGSATEQEECSGQPESDQLQEHDAASAYSKAASPPAHASSL